MGGRNLYILCMILSFLHGCITVHPDNESTLVPSPSPVPRIGKATIRAYLNAVNQIRTEGRYCGGTEFYPAVAPLKWNSHLYRSAYEHSNDMAKSNFFHHSGSNTIYDTTASRQHLGHPSTFRERIENNGYVPWKHIAENIELGAKDIHEAIRHWLSSKPHCIYIMSPAFQDIGMAHVKREGTSPENYWTQDLGSRAYKE